MRWTQVIAGVSYAERGWSHICRIYAAGDRKLACGLWQTLLRSLAVNGRYLHDQLRPSHGHCTFGCDKSYIGRKLVSQVWLKLQLVRVFAFTCDNLLQPSVTYRIPRVTNALVTYEGKLSCKNGVTCGVPQGSVCIRTYPFLILY